MKWKNKIVCMCMLCGQFASLMNKFLSLYFLLSIICKENNCLLFRAISNTKFCTFRENIILYLLIAIWNFCLVKTRFFVSTNVCISFQQTPGFKHYSLNDRKLKLWKMKVFIYDLRQYRRITELLKMCLSGYDHTIFSWKPRTRYQFQKWMFYVCKFTCFLYINI